MLHVCSRVRAGTHYPHVTWAHVMLRVQLGCERRFNIEFYDADSHFCHSAYVTWSHVELWSAHAPARFSHFCCRTHFVRRDQCVDCSRALDTLVTLQPLILAFLLRIPCVLRCAAPPYYLRSHIYHRFKTKTFQAWDSHTLSKEHLSLCTP